MLPQTRFLKNIRTSFANYKLRVRRVSLCSVVRSTAATTRWRYNVQLSSGLRRHVRSLPIAERKRCVRLIWGDKSFWASVPLWRQTAPLIRHAPISLPVWGLLGNCYFFIFFVLLSFYIYYLIPTNLTKIYFLLPNIQHGCLNENMRIYFSFLTAYSGGVHVFVTLADVRRQWTSCRIEYDSSPFLLHIRYVGVF